MPEALAIGVDYNLFWSLNPKRLKPFLEANKLKLKQQNEFMWLQGMYIFDAVSVAIYNNFKDKGKKSMEYLQEPLEIFKPTPEEMEARAERERQKVIAFFNNLERQFKNK